MMDQQAVLRWILAGLHGCLSLLEQGDWASIDEEAEASIRSAAARIAGIQAEMVRRRAPERQD